MIQYYYTKKEWGVVMEKEKLKILEELRRILNNKNEAIIILNNYFKGGVGKSKLSTMFAYLTDKLNLKVLMIDKDLQATLTKGLLIPSAPIHCGFWEQYRNLMCNKAFVVLPPQG
ncbi:AAA family ATPase [Staphylococcus pseudintermedius]|nr:AAA family ATPase [Staphylococcus pseudintermedius]WMZ64548.1 AAA family ATPase [Staphylococcus pseudintermedius]